MNNLNRYFLKQGSLYLQDIDYKLISLESMPKNVKTDYKDNLKVELIDDNQKLRIVFTREVKHTPNELFDLSVSFGAEYTFNEEYSGKDELNEIDFKSMLEENKNMLFLNIIARTSQLISQITSSHGQYPLVTPPVYIK